MLLCFPVYSQMNTKYSIKVAENTDSNADSVSRMTVSQELGCICSINLNWIFCSEIFTRF